MMLRIIKEGLSKEKESSIVYHIKARNILHELIYCLVTGILTKQHLGS